MLLSYYRKAGKAVALPRLIKSRPKSRLCLSRRSGSGFLKAVGEMAKFPPRKSHATHYLSGLQLELTVSLELSMCSGYQREHTAIQAGERPALCPVDENRLPRYSHSVTINLVPRCVT